MTLLLPAASAQGLPLVRQAKLLEEKGRWYEACCIYDELLSKDRNQFDLREAYRNCLRRFRQQRRLQDGALQSVLAKRTREKSLQLYDQVLDTVLGNYVERDRIDLTALFQQGIKELQNALQEPLFRNRYLARASTAARVEFENRLAGWAGERVLDRIHATRLLRQVIQAAAVLRLPAGVVALECACGACNSLDEYSLYLAPHRYAHAAIALKNKFVGIGIELTVSNRHLEIARVYKKSPAAEAGLARGSRIVRIDGTWLDPAAPDVAAERLRGEAGSDVELEVILPGDKTARMFKIKRRDVQPTSVDAELRGDKGGEYIGYIRIHNFQESTALEVREALMGWRGMPLRGVILDLRGNPGGLFKSALAVAELFLPEGVIVYTHSQLREFNRTYKSHNADPFLYREIILLVDGETASAAEIVVGALKDNHKALVIGHPTYGKGSIQCVIPLEGGPGGLRLTVAKFSTPARVAFSGVGILPDRVVSEGDGDLALKVAEELLRADSAMPMPMMLR
jgi:carboxyl-terminal processing protease